MRRCPFYSMKASVGSFSDAIGMEMGFLQYLSVFPSSHRKKKKREGGSYTASKVLQELSQATLGQMSGNRDATMVAPSALFCLILTSWCPQQGNQGEGLLLVVLLQEVKGAMAIVWTRAGWHG